MGSVGGEVGTKTEEKRGKRKIQLKTSIYFPNCRTEIDLIQHQSK